MNIGSLGASFSSAAAAGSDMALTMASKVLAQSKVEGQAAVDLIRSSNPSDGRGRYVNTYA